MNSVSTTPESAACAPAARWWSIIAVGALAFVFAYPMQINGYNQNAHYALVRALAQGTPVIDKTRHEIGDLGTGDISLIRGHYYSNKAPGLAFATLPAFSVVEAVGMRTTGDPTRVIWALHVWSIALPALGLVLLVRWAGNQVDPGYGTAAAVTLGLGTLVLPFSTLFFSHVLSAFLGFAAFALLWYERAREPRLGLVAAAGVLAGLALTTEYPLLIVGAVLGLYALSRASPVRRALAYALGAIIGVLPLLLYNLWAFGSMTHLTAADERADHVGFYGFSTPSLSVLFDLLFSAWGLVTLTPVLVCGLVGAALMARHGRRGEALAIVAIVGLLLAFVSGLHGFSQFGGYGPPRYLITILPFLAVPLAAAFRSFPLTTVALAVVSGFQMVVQTATNPLAAYDGGSLGRLIERDVSQTAASIVAVTGWYTILPFFAAVLLVVVFAARDSRPLLVRPVEILVAVFALLGWVLVALGATNPQGGPPGTNYVIGLTVFAAGVAALLGRRGVLASRAASG
jgi:hypothetical protein